MIKASKLFLIGISLIIFSALCSSIGQLVLKLLVMNDMSRIFYVVGVALYGMGALSMLIAFRFGSISVLHPLMSLGYVMAIIWAGMFLNETITFEKIIGITLIIAGNITLGVTGSIAKK
jgi:uncharacterized membrane protein